MKLVRLRYFVAVAKELNFTRAAAKLRVAQPALSRQIRTLENEVGVELLVRDGRALKLTPAGEVLSEEGAIILAHYALATQRARDAANRNSTVRVGIGFGLGEHVDRVVTRHTGSFADVHIQPQNIPSTVQNLALKKCEIDIGFLRPPVDAGYLSCHFLFEERLSALVPAVSPFTRYKTVRLSQLANIPLLLPRRHLSSGLYDRILDLYRVRGITPEIVHTPHSGPGEESGHMLVASRKGIYIVYASLAIFPVFTKRVKVLPLDERMPAFRFTSLGETTRSPARSSTSCERYGVSLKSTMFDGEVYRTEHRFTRCRLGGLRVIGERSPFLIIPVAAKCSLHKAVCPV